METHYNDLNRKPDKLQREKQSKRKNRHLPPTHKILYQNGQPNKNKIHSTGNSITQQRTTI